jgi:argininosuccinate lyase
MLDGAKDRLAADRAWLDATRKKLIDASAKLDEAFSRLRG